MDDGNVFTRCCTSAPRVRTRKYEMKSVCSFRWYYRGRKRALSMPSWLSSAGYTSALLPTPTKFSQIGANGDIQHQRYGGWMVSYCVNRMRTSEIERLSRENIFTVSITHFSTFDASFILQSEPRAPSPIGSKPSRPTCLKDPHSSVYSKIRHATRLMSIVG